MISLVRVDDRLLHGQIICAWVPYLRADSLVVASDEAASDSLASEIISSCGCEGLDVYVKSVGDVVKDIIGGVLESRRVILIVGDLKDAMRVYEEGLRFKALNIGNLHHDGDGRVVAPSVILGREDDEIIERFESMGVEIDIRAVPAGPSARYRAGGD